MPGLDFSFINAVSAQRQTCAKDKTEWQSTNTNKVLILKQSKVVVVILMAVHMSMGSELVRQWDRQTDRQTDIANKKQCVSKRSENLKNSHTKSKKGIRKQLLCTTRNSNTLYQDYNVQYTQKCDDNNAQRTETLYVMTMYNIKKLYVMTMYTK